jgi:hypothetical protein
MAFAAALTLFAAQQPVAVPAFAPPLRTRSDAAEWARAHQPEAAELPWVQRPWHFDLANAAEQAWREGAPLALWLGDGHPFGCAAAAELALRPAWSAPEVRAAARAFVLCADDARELAAARGFAPALDAWLARAAADAPLEPGTVLFAAADGTPLGRSRPADAAELAAAFAAAAAQWEAGPAAAAAPPAPPERPGPLPRFRRRADAFPLDGFAMEIIHHRLDAAPYAPPEWLDTPWNRDWLWIADPALIAPVQAGTGLGARGEWPRAAAAEFARLVLADASAGRVPTFADEEVLLAELTAQPMAVRQDRRGIRLSGELLAQRGGQWEQDQEGLFAAGRWRGGAGASRARALLTGWMEVHSDGSGIASLQIAALVQSVDERGVRHHLVLARHLQAVETASRLAASGAPGAFAGDACGPLPRAYRALAAEALPELDGSLAEKVWLGAPWSEEFGAGARAKLLWDPERLHLAVWSPSPRIAVRVAGSEFQADASGAVEGVEGARCAARDVGGAWTFELALPWSALAQAGAAGLPPVAGARLRVNVRAGGDDDAWWSPAGGDARVLLEPSRAMSFAPSGGGFR